MFVLGKTPREREFLGYSRRNASNSGKDTGGRVLFVESIVSNGVTHHLRAQQADRTPEIQISESLCTMSGNRCTMRINNAA